MKFKTLYIVFNAVIAAAFLFIFLLPLALLGADSFRMFARHNWLAALLFAVTLIIINGYFAYNWKLFSLLEREDWPQLIRHLEASTRRSLRRGTCRLLLHAYLLAGDTGPVAALEARVRRERPGLLKALALPFGLPYLLRGDAAAAAAYFGPLADSPGVSDRGWLGWNLGFSLMQLKRYEEALAALTGLLDRRPEPALHLLTLFLLDTFSARQPEVRQRVDLGRDRLRRLDSPAGWQRRLESGGGNPQLALLAPTLREAREWLFSDRAAGRSS